MWHSQQYTPTFPTTCPVTHYQCHSQTNSVPFALQQHEVATNHDGSDCSNRVTSAIQQYPRQPPTNNVTDMNLVQIRILLVQLEEINIQFARLLETIEKSLAKPNNITGNQLNPMDAPNVNMIKISQSTPSLHNQYPALPLCDPTGWMFFLLSPLDRNPPTMRTPPWPPPMSQMISHNQDTPWYHMQLTNLLPTPDAHILRLTQHRQNSIWTTPALNHIPCPFYFTNKHDHPNKALVRPGTPVFHRHSSLSNNLRPLFCKPMKHVRFKTLTLCNPGPMMFWPKEDMRPP